jgi:hypothetical protein
MGTEASGWEEINKLLSRLHWTLHKNKASSDLTQLFMAVRHVFVGSLTLFRSSADETVK